MLDKVVNTNPIKTRFYVERSAKLTHDNNFYKRWSKKILRTIHIKQEKT